MTVLDSTAMIAYLANEDGSDVIENAMPCLTPHSPASLTA